jgi:hypothetical protein
MPWAEIDAFNWRVDSAATPVAAMSPAGEVGGLAPDSARSKPSPLDELSSSDCE